MDSQNRCNRVSILDIRRDDLSSALLNDIHEMLRPEEGGQKRLPTSLLYDAQGLRLFEEITFLEEYYLTNAEIEALENHASDIASLIPGGSQIVELGSGYALIFLERSQDRSGTRNYDADHETVISAKSQFFYRPLKRAERTLNTTLWISPCQSCDGRSSLLPKRTTDT